MTHYRPDIDGLRAVAVLSVLFFHAGFSTFSGGFVGVDVFFVISGYLITQILIKSVDKGTFSISEFYKRRALRILPAYTAMCLLSTSVAIWLLPPGPLTDFSESLLSSALFGANFYFAGQMNYFQSAAEELPLLHMWSLSVEEQFYVIWPFVIMFISLAFLRRVRVLLVAVGLLGGLALCEWAIRNKSQTMVFFYTPFRAWELMVGALVAMLPAMKMNRRLSTALSAMGALLIAGAVLYYEPHHPLFPGVSAFVPCLGAALIIVTGASEPNLFHRLLSGRYVVFIGLLSYSLYLWHWPVFAFARYLNQGQLGFALSLTLSAVSVGLAYLSWQYIEKPFRTPTGSLPRFAKTTPVLGAALGVMVFTAASALILIHKDGLPSRASDLALLADHALDSQHDATRKCLRERTPEGSDLSVHRCVLGDISAPPTAVLWGDSHANAFAPALEEYFKDKQRSFELLAMRGCSPISVAEWEPDFGGRSVRACEEFNRAVADFLISEEHIHTVYVSSYWSSKIERMRVLELASYKQMLGVTSKDEDRVAFGILSWIA